jgi:hypothetical protein
MRRTCLIVTLAALAVVTARLDGQSPPDFSGTWTMASPGSSSPDQRVTIAQDADTLSIDSTWYHLVASTNGRRTETPYPVRVTYVLDGAEHPSRVVADPPRVAARPASALGLTSATEESSSKATWAGRQLVVMTYETERIAAPSLTPAVARIRKTIRHTLSLAADGTLVWETLILADPLPWGREVSAPTPSRKIYTRTQ